MTSSVTADALRHSALLRFKIQLASTPRQAAGAALWAHPRLAEIFPRALMRAYTISNASVPLMEAARARALTLANDDPVAAGLADYLEHHIPEETGHDEWMINDLEALGISRHEVVNRVPEPSLAALIGMQYYWIQHRHPIAFTGYAAIVEGNPVPPAKIDEIEQRLDLPARALRTMRWHAVHDLEHSADLDDALDGLPLTDEHTALIGINVAYSQALLARSVHEMIGPFDIPSDDASDG